jgi:hypothetical protein
MAERDWRRTPRSTALDGLLTGTNTFTWRQASGEGPEGLAEADESIWEGLTDEGSE